MQDIKRHNYNFFHGIVVAHERFSLITGVARARAYLLLVEPPTDRDFRNLAAATDIVYVNRAL